MTPDKRVFSEKEASEIVRRAAQLHEQALESASPYKPGVTREELERIAIEVGIDPTYIERAILEGSRPESRKGPLHLTEEFERVIEGELDPNDFDVGTNALRVMHRHQGRGAAQVGRSLNATSWTGVSQANVHVSSRNGRTRLNVKSNALFAWLFALHPAFILSIIAIGATSEAGLIWLGLGIVGALALAGWAGFRTLLKTGHKRAGELTDRLAAVIADENASQAVLGSATTTTVADAPRHIELGDASG